MSCNNSESVIYVVTTFQGSCSNNISDSPNMPYPPPLRKTNSIGSWGLVESWIDKCLTSHKDCKKVHEHSEDTSPSRQHFPARLIDIGLEDNYSDVRIVKSSGLVEPFEHVALSHCWGNIPILRLLKNNQKPLQIDCHLRNYPGPSNTRLKPLDYYAKVTIYGIFGSTVYVLFKMTMKTGELNQQKWLISMNKPFVPLLQRLP